MVVVLRSLVDPWSVLPAKSTVGVASAGFSVMPGGFPSDICRALGKVLSLHVRQTVLMNLMRDGWLLWARFLLTRTSSKVSRGVPDSICSRGVVWPRYGCCAMGPQ